MNENSQTLADILTEYVDEGSATANELRAIGVAMQIITGEWGEDG